ncbi:MAG TPA: hemolysin family protein [Pyrinomonadaceae bacterium]|jgi:CBS domain containing-hemolysin-like protein|nr:hemolysin family protein [Pyrinomonadaceae bacterium]
MDDPASSFLLLLQATDPVTPITATEVIVNFLLILFIVGMNAFFVASEFSLVTVRKTRVQKQADEGSSGAKAALRLLDNPTQFISAVQLGVTLASLALGWRGEPTIARLLEPLAESVATEGTAAYVAHGFAIFIAFALITFLHVVLGELVPKMFALERAEAFALFAARPLEVFAKVFSPILAVLNYAGSLFGKALGLSSNLDHTSVYTEEELRQLVALSQESGQINVEERTLINKVFEFSETTVKEAMIPRTEIIAIPETSTLEDISKAFEESGYSRLPVYRNSLDEITGFIHSKDLVPFLLRPRSFKLGKILHKPSYVVDTAKLEDVLRQMQTEKFHFGFVVDEHGGVEGIITLEDLLEEIVGDISDEHDEEVNEQIDQQADGAYLLDGGLAVRDLNRRLEIDLPVSEAYTTIAGFLMSQAGEILPEGAMVPYNGHTFRVEKVDKRRIRQVRMETTANEPSAAQDD